MWFINNALHQKTCSVTPWLVKTLGTNLLYDIIGSIKTGKISCVCGLSWQKALHSFPPVPLKNRQTGLQRAKLGGFQNAPPPFASPPWTSAFLVSTLDVAKRGGSSNSLYQLAYLTKHFWWARYKMAIYVLSLTHRTVWLALTVLFCLL